MTYESAFQWVIDNIDVSEFDNYEQFYDRIEDKMQTPKLTDNPDFEQMAIDYWSANGMPEEQEDRESVTIETPTGSKDVNVEPAYIITQSGITPAVIADTNPKVVSEPRIVIGQPAPTGQPISRTSLRQRISNIGSAISSFFRRRK